MVLLCYAFAYHLTSPVRRLRAVVDCFGRGDFSARAAANRKDELGELATSFNQMADRIQTLLAAERRLLLDISHELRSPLARLGVAMELARSGEDREHMLDRIQKEADRLNELVEELLQVTRVEGDPSAQKTDAVQLDELLADLVYDSLLEAKAKDCTLLLKAPASVTLNGRRRADPARHRERDSQCHSLCAARHASGYRTQRNRTGWHGFRCATTDPACRKRRCRGSSIRSTAWIRTATVRAAGLGLGLAIARRSVELHKGKLSARNANPGLLVTIELPIAVEAPTSSASKAAIPAPVSTS